MKPMLYAMAALLVLSAQLSHAQGCASSWNFLQINCSSNSCSSSVIISYPNAGQDGVPILRTVAYCCGQGWATAYPGQGGCHVTELKTPKSQERLARLAKTSEILIANCSGQYVLYSDAHARRERTFINDHILR